MRVKLFAGVVSAALVSALVSVPAPAPASDTSSISETLAAMNDHTVLATGVKEAGERATLRAPGPYTVFAPPDAAFLKLDHATVRALATEPAAVKRFVRGHVVSGKLTPEELKKLAGKEVRTLEGNALKVEDAPDGLRVGGAKITTANIGCTNGVIHVIDAVLPGAKQ
jgi:uncharacterized surface protein with fasciclin (FAS1) repeats